MKISKEYTTDFVASADGTTIGYRQLGTGEGLILLHGGLMASQNFMKLAKELSNSFTVYIPDRRGRGLSSKIDSQSLQKESEDLQTIIDKTKSKFVFGLSSGAIIILKTLINKSTVKKAVLYEPPLKGKHMNPQLFANKYKIGILDGNFGKAFIAIVKGTDDTSLIGKIPSFLTIPFFNLAIKAESKNIKDDDVSLQNLIEAFKYDINVVENSASLIENCQKITTDVMLLGGQKSSNYLKQILVELELAIPNCRRIEIKNVGHLASDNSENPNLVADELKKYFKSELN